MNNFIFACVAMSVSVAMQAQPSLNCMKIGYADMPYILGKMPAAKQIEVELKSLEMQMVLKKILPAATTPVRPVVE